MKMIRRTLASLMGNQEPEITEDATLSTPTAEADQETDETAPAPASDDVEPAAEPSAEPVTEPEAQAAEPGESMIRMAAGMTMISVAELETLRTSAAEWNAKKGEFEVLNTWYNNMKASGSIPQRDVSDAVVGEQEKVSKATQIAINKKRTARQAK